MNLKTIAATVALTGLALTAQATTLDFGPDFPVTPSLNSDVIAVFKTSTSSLGPNTGGYPLQNLPASISSNLNDYNQLNTAIKLVDWVVSGHTSTTTPYAAGDGQLGGALSKVNGRQAVPGGFDYVLARYDGNNGGLVLFELDGHDALIPFDSYDIFNSITGGRNPHPDQNSYAMSHYTLIGEHHDRKVPDGGATVALLGVGLLGLGAIRRKLS